ncbi:MAG: hypothetical protein HQK49_20740 [Oligoflexia bacterium]|nr:hypothetical protein [Oligoflexia bacterium]
MIIEQHLKNNHYYNHLSEFFVAHSDLISQLSIWVIDSIFLFGKLFPNKVPKHTGDGAFMILNYIGIVSIPFQIRSMIKNIQDTLFSYNRKKSERILVVILASSLSGICTLIGIIDIMVMSLAATLITFGGSKFSYLPPKIFAILIPINSVVIFFLILLEIYRVLMNKHILKKINSEFLNATLNQLATQIIITTLARTTIVSNQSDNQGKCPITSSAINLAIKIRTQMDVNTWKRCQQTITFLNLNNNIQLTDYILGPIKNDIAIGNTDNISNLALRALGYFCMFISRTHPNSLQQALAYWSMSTLYGIKNSIIKIFQALQRRRMLLLTTTE